MLEATEASIADVNRHELFHDDVEFELVDWSGLVSTDAVLKEVMDLNWID